MYGLYETQIPETLDERMNDFVYLIPGRGNRLSDLGNTLTGLGFDVYGREIAPPFSNLRFSDQLRIIQKDLMSLAWTSQAKLIGHSYGGYLLMHSLSELAPFPGRVLLLSPVLGAALNRDVLYFSRPPRADRLLELAERGEYPPPALLEIYTGEDDDGCDPALARRISSLIPSARITIVGSQGHTLSSAIVQKALIQFLKIPANTASA